MDPKRLLKRIRSGASSNVAFRDLQRLLISLSFELIRIEGSHHIFAREGIPKQVNIQADRNGQVKPYQVRQLRRLLDDYDLSLEDN